MNYVERIEVVLPNGEVIQSDRLSSVGINKKAREKSLEGSIYARLPQLIDKNVETFKKNRPSGFDSYGYPAVLQARQKKSLDLMPLFFGAQGTLGVITEVILKAIPIPNEAQRVVATFSDFDMAHKFLELAKSLKPRELDIYDIRIIKTAEETGKRLSEITNKMETGFVVFAKYDEHAKSALRKLSSVRKSLPKDSQLIVDSPKSKVALDEFENSLVSFLNQVRSGERVPVVTDFYLPSNNMKNFLSDLSILESSLKMELALFGSYSGSNYSLRPKFNVEDEEFGKKVVTFLRTGAFVIKRQGGAITGGAPEGRVKALITNTMPEDEKKFYTDIKKIFDHYDIMNPGAKVGADARFTLRHFRDDTAKITV